MNKETALSLLRNMIQFDKFDISDSAIHEIKEFCQMVTHGVNERHYVEQLRPSESKEQKEQRGRQYYSQANYAAKQILKYVRRLQSVEDVSVSIEGATDEQSAKLNNRLKNFFDEKTLLEYVIGVYADWQGFDPNSLLLLTTSDVKDATGALIGREVLPVQIESNNIVFLSEKKGVIDFGITKTSRTIQYDASTNMKLKIEQISVTDFYVYSEGYSLILIRDASDLKSLAKIDPPPFELENEPFESLYVQKKDGTLIRYKVYSYQQEGYPCPLISMSSRIDIVTKAKTSILLGAKAQFKELIARVSELDVAIQCHVFPQKIMLTSECNYEDAHGNHCEHGRCGGQTCQMCNGTGKKVHTSSQDVIMLTVPNGTPASEFPDVQKMVHYVQVDEFAANFLETKTKDILAQISSAIFETNIFSGVTTNSSKSNANTPQNGVTETATKTLIDWQKMYMSLKEDALHVEKMCSLIAKYISVAEFGANNIVVNYNFPKDFKFMTIDELIVEYGKAINAGLPFDVIEKILCKIIEKQTPDNAQLVAWNLMKLKHKPFSDKAKDEIKAIIQSRASDDFDRVLWENFDSIFDELEEEKPQMVAMTYVEQKNELLTKVADYAKTIKVSTSNDLNSIFDTVNN